jgi:hypothetical protein
MKLCSGILVMLVLLAGGTRTLAVNFAMDKLAVTTKYTEEKPAQNWLTVAANVKGDWLTAKLSGKFYGADLAENHEDSSSAGTDDLFSKVGATFNFAGWGKGLEVPLSYKWNENYQICHYGLSYEWRPWKMVKLGFGYGRSDRRVLEDRRRVWNYQLDQAEMSLKYEPKSWSYKLKLTRSDKVYPNFSAGAEAAASRYNNNYTALKYLWDQDVGYQVNDRLKLGLGYNLTTTDYYQDRLRTVTGADGMAQVKGKEKGQSYKFNVSGKYQLSEGWKLTGSYGRSDYTGYNGDYASDIIKLEGKYTVKGQWWLAAKLHLSDLSYSYGYQLEEDAAEDDDQNYNSRFQQTLALEYFRKLTACTYNLEVFAKHYDYDATANHGAAGVIATLTWEWLHWNWSVQAAPNGNLSSSRARYSFTTKYQF